MAWLLSFMRVSGAVSMSTSLTFTWWNNPVDQDALKRSFDFNFGVRCHFLESCSHDFNVVDVCHRFWSDRSESG